MFSFKKSPPPLRPYYCLTIRVAMREAADKCIAEREEMLRRQQLIFTTPRIFVTHWNQLQQHAPAQRST